MDNLRIVFAPHTRGPKAQVGAGLLRERGSELAQRRDRAERALDQFKKYFETTPTGHRFEVIDAIETGDLAKLNPKEQAFVTTMRDLFAFREKEILDLGLLRDFLENYFPHLWKDPAKAETWQQNWSQKKPLPGGESYRKQRTIPTMKEGMDDPNFKLVPAFDNPVDWVLTKLAEEDKSITAHRIKEELVENGNARYVPVFYKAPQGWAKIEDKLFTQYGKPTVTVTEAFDKQLRERLYSLADSLGIQRERKPAIGGTRLGYSQGGKIVTKFATPDSVIAHEIGHQLEDKFGLFDLLKARDYPERTKELRALADLRFEGDANVSKSYKSYVRKKDEKIANAIAALVYAPRAFREAAPNTWDYLRDELWHASPKLRPIFDIGTTMTLDKGTAEVPVGGLVTMGHYWAPEPLARVINNYLSPGVRSSNLVKAWSAVNRTLNMVELGASWFHGMTTMLNSSISDMAIGMEQVAAGHPIQGAASLGRGVVPFASMVQDYLAGKNLQKAWDGAPTDPMTAALLTALKQGGGQARQDPYWTTSFVDGLMKAWRGGNVLGAGIRAPYALLELTLAPIMKTLVPRVKMGAFLKLAQMELEKHPQMTPDEAREAFGKVWDSIDNRFGQLSQRNLFMHALAKDTMNMAVGRPGWTLGTIREFYGGGKDLAHLVLSLTTGGKVGGPPKLTHKAAYVLASILGMAVLHALLQLALSGELPKDQRDLFAPRDGGTNPDGSPSRVILPLYIAKDIYGYATRPLQTLQAKLAPGATIAADLIRNRNWKNEKIYGEGGMGVGKFVGGYFVPYSAQGIARNLDEGKSLLKTAAPLVGLNAAPRSMGMTKAQERLAELRGEKAPGTLLVPSARNRLKSQITRAVRAHDPEKARELARKGFQDGMLTRDDLFQSIKRAAVPKDLGGFRSLPLPEALDILEIATPEEKRMFLPSLVQKIRNGAHTMPISELRKAIERYKQIQNQQ